MLIVTPSELAKQAGNKYMGVLVAAKFARFVNDFPTDRSVRREKKLTTQALEELVGWCRDAGPGVSIPMLIEQARDSRHAELLAHALAWGEDLRESEEQARVGLQHTLWSLEIKRKDREIKSLGDRLQKGQLSKEEHVQYARMVAEMQALKRRLQDESRSIR